MLRVAAGETCLSIADDLERRGAPRPGRLPWTRSRVWELAANASHPTGIWICRGGEVGVSVPPIVSMELAERARAALAAKAKSGLDRTRHVYLLARLARCSCGQMIRVRSVIPDRRRSHARPARYMCIGRVTPLPHGAVRCDALTVDQASTDDRAWAAICRELEDPALVPALLSIRAERAGDSHDWEADAAGYRRHLARLEGVESALLARFRRGAISAAAMDAELAALGRDRRMVEEQIRGAERARGAAARATRRLEDAEAIVTRLRARLASATPEERRAIVATIVDPGGVVLDGDRIRVELWIERPAADVQAIEAVRPWSEGHESKLRIRLVA